MELTHLIESGNYVDEFKKHKLVYRKYPDLDLMVVIGGYNSSNTNNLARIASTFTSAFHIQDASSIVGPDEIRHKLPGASSETRTSGWLALGPKRIGLTAGASTPNNQIGEAIERIVGFRDTTGLLKLREVAYAGR